MSQSTANSNVQNRLSADAIQIWLIAQLAQQLGVEPEAIDRRQPLDSYGLDSAQAMSLISKAERLLGFELSPLLLWHYPTVEALSQRLAEEFEESESEVFEI